MFKLVIGLAAVGIGALFAAGCSLGGQTDSDSPILIITSPTSDTVSGAVLFSADARDASGIAKVRFSVDNTVLIEVFTAPYSTVWQTGVGLTASHTLKAEAFDPTGNSTLVTKVVIVTAPKQ